MRGLASPSGQARVNHTDLPRGTRLLPHTAGELVDEQEPTAVGVLRPGVAHLGRVLHVAIDHRHPHAAVLDVHGDLERCRRVPHGVA